jgi:hypothetical protein
MHVKSVFLLSYEMPSESETFVDNSTTFHQSVIV